jgi:hypothetical protein
VRGVDGDRSTVGRHDVEGVGTGVEDGGARAVGNGTGGGVARGA